MTDSTEPSFNLRLFGPFSLAVSGVRVDGLRARKQQYLLSLLALRSGRAVERTWLAGTLWPESTESQALFNLRMSLMALRKLMGGEGSRIVSPSRQTLALDTAGACIDVLEFDRWIAAGDPDSLVRAIEIYRGPLLEGCLEEWAASERMQCEETLVRAVEAFADQSMERGDPRGAILPLRRAAAIAPLRESLARRLMTAHAASGSHGEAIRAYRRLRKHLLDELHAEPSVETASLLESIVSKGYGTRRAPDSAPPDPILPAEEASRLPAPLTPFLGREREVREIRRGVSRHRLVTLLGAGGVGKTRLALRVGEEMAGRFPDGVRFVDLAPLADPALVPAETAAAVDLPTVSGERLVDHLCAYLKDRSILLIFDNCEHVIEAVTSLAQSLLTRCPSLRLLATSRHELGIPGEKIIVIPPLSLPPPLFGNAAALEGEAFRSIRRSEAVRFFEERARSVLPSFRITPENAGKAAEIAVRLEGLPLALEMAAARVRVLTVPQIAERLDRRLSLLVHGAGRPSRQQTMKACIDWSIQLLRPAERRLLRDLSLFAGGFSLAAAEAVGAETVHAELVSTGSVRAEAVHAEVVFADLVETGSARFGTAQTEPEIDCLPVLVESLLAKSLIERRDSLDGSPRFAMLETVREYCRELRRAEGEDAGPARRFAAYFAGLAEEMERRLYGPEQIEALDRLEEENDNLRVAFDAALSDSGDLRIAMRLAAALYWFWYRRGHLSEGIERMKAVLDRVGPEEETELRARLLHGMGILSYYEGDRRDPIDWMEQSARIYSRLGIRRGIALNRIYQSICTNVQGDRETTERIVREGVSIFRKAGDRWGLGMALWAHGSMFVYEDAAAARSILEESVSIFREIGDDWGLSASVRCLGHAHLAFGDRDTARSLFEEAVRLALRVGDRLRAAYFIGDLVEMAKEAERYDEVAAVLRGLDIDYRWLGNRVGRVFSNLKQGQIEHLRGHPDAARLFCQDSISFAEQVGERSIMGHALVGLGLLDLAEGDLHRAAGGIREGLACFRGGTDRAGWFRTLEAVAAWLLADGEPETAAVMLGWTGARCPDLPFVQERDRRAVTQTARERLGETLFEKYRADGAERETIDDLIEQAERRMETAASAVPSTARGDEPGP